MTWDESKHKRGQPENAGQFGPGGGTSTAERPKEAKKDGPRRLTGQQRAALEWYSGDGWVQVNAALRGESDVRGDAPRPASEFRSTIQAIDGAIEAAGETVEPMRLYRGIRVADPEAFVRSFKTGDSLTMKGYQSTSQEPAVAVASGNVLLRISSTRGLPMRGISKNPGEREVLLGHGWGYEVTEVQMVEFRGRKIPALVLKVKA